VHIDCDDDSGVTRTLLDDLGFTGEIGRRGVPAPLQVENRWVVERTRAWMNGHGKLSRCTENTRWAVDSSLLRAAAFVVPAARSSGNDSAIGSRRTAKRLESSRSAYCRLSQWVQSVPY
jgi:hypothetical protein